MGRIQQVSLCLNPWYKYQSSFCPKIVTTQCQIESYYNKLGLSSAKLSYSWGKHTTVLAQPLLLSNEWCLTITITVYNNSRNV